MERVILDGSMAKKSSGLLKLWKTYWFELTTKNLRYSSKKGDFDHKKIAEDLCICSVKGPINDVCFELITPTKRILFKVNSLEACQQWIKAIQKQAQNSIEGSELTRRSSNALEFGSSASAKSFPIETNCYQSNENRQKTLQEIFALPGNTNCADCQKADPKWTSINFGILICTECAGIHRGLDVRVKSLTMDGIPESQWNILKNMGGNTKVNSILLADSKEGELPTENSTKIEIQTFIEAKYRDKKFCNKMVEPASPCHNHELWSSGTLRQEILLSRCLGNSSAANPFYAEYINRNRTHMTLFLIEGRVPDDPNDNKILFSARTNATKLWEIASSKTELQNFALQAIINKNLNQMLNLIVQGLDINLPISGHLLLHLAVKKNDSIMVEFLLLNGARTYLLDCEEDTALHIAASEGFALIVYQILCRNPDTKVKNKKGQTVREVAIEKQRALIVTLLNFYNNKDVLDDFNAMEDIHDILHEYMNIFSNTEV